MVVCITVSVMIEDLFCNLWSMGGGDKMVVKMRGISVFCKFNGFNGLVIVLFH